MKIHVVLKSTNKVEQVLFCKSKEHRDLCLKKLNQYQKRLPNSYNRHKQGRNYCYKVDKKIQKLLGVDNFWFSMYSGNQYKYLIQ